MLEPFVELLRDCQEVGRQTVCVAVSVSFKRTPAVAVATTVSSTARISRVVDSSTSADEVAP